MGGGGVGGGRVWGNSIRTTFLLPWKGSICIYGMDGGRKEGPGFLARMDFPLM